MAKQHKATQNAALHGRSKVEQEREEARQEHETRALDGKKRDREPGVSEPDDKPA
ncbi:MAG: DUF4169 family protein [Rhodobacteraceae bacterium]|nr:DUF4169 family protein [Paracoccaceae bacterium]